MCKILYPWMISFLLVSLSACASSGLSHPTTPFSEVKSAIMSPATQAASLAVDPALTQAFQHSLSVHPTPAMKAEGFETFVYNVSRAPLLKTTPFEETVISLEPGEKFTQVSSGDPSRWSYTVAVSGSGASEQQHILVKPAQADIRTNLVITTDRRLYTLRLGSLTGGKPTHRVQFEYPDRPAKNKSTDLSPDDFAPPGDVLNFLPFHRLHFNYKISQHWFAPAPVWKPLRVFDDETHTYIEFPPSIVHGDLPAFFVLDDSGHPLLANYRSRPPYFVVDTLFKRAVLVMNVGRRQSKITLTHRG